MPPQHKEARVTVSEIWQYAPDAVSLSLRTASPLSLMPLPASSPLGYGRSYRAMASGIRLRQPQHVVMPLSSDEVANFWSSFHTFRDLALVALMLLDGLRSQETLDLQLEDLQLADAQIRVLGKGNRQRLLPLPPETIEVLRNYLRLERL